MTALQEAIEKLLGDERLRRTLGENGRVKLQNEFTWRRVTDRVLASYGRLLDDK